MKEKGRFAYPVNRKIPVPPLLFVPPQMLIEARYQSVSAFYSCSVLIPSLGGVLQQRLVLERFQHLDWIKKVRYRPSVICKGPTTPDVLGRSQGTLQSFCTDRAPGSSRRLFAAGTLLVKTQTKERKKETLKAAW